MSMVDEVDDLVDDTSTWVIAGVVVVVGAFFLFRKKE